MMMIIIIITVLLMDDDPCDCDDDVNDHCCTTLGIQNDDHWIHQESIVRSSGQLCPCLVLGYNSGEAFVVNTNTNTKTHMYTTANKSAKTITDKGQLYSFFV